MMTKSKTDASCARRSQLIICVYAVVKTIGWCWPVCDKTSCGIAWLRVEYYTGNKTVHLDLSCFCCVVVVVGQRGREKDTRKRESLFFLRLHYYLHIRICARAAGNECTKFIRADNFSCSVILFRKVNMWFQLEIAFRCFCYYAFDFDFTFFAIFYWACRVALLQYLSVKQ